MQSLEFFANVASYAMVGFAAGAGLAYGSTADIGTQWRWLICGGSVIGVILWITFGHSVARSLMDATRKNINTENQE